MFLHKLNNTTQSVKLQAMLVQGNHKSAIVNQDQLLQLIFKDVHYRFSMPINTAMANLIKGAAVQPLGLVTQWTLNSNRSRVQKSWMTQDLLFLPLNLLNSVNVRIDMTAYPQMIYSWCLPQLFYFIVVLQYHSPKLCILIATYNYSNAYHCLYGPHIQGHSTDHICHWPYHLHLANKISQCDSWDPTKLFNPDQPKSLTPIILPLNIPLMPAINISVLPPCVNGKVDVFIDNLINVFLDTEANCKQQPHVVPLAAYVTNHSHAGDTKPIPHCPIISIPKLLT